MTDFVTSVMQAAAIEVLQREADQIDQEVQQLLAEIEHASAAECRGGGFTRRLLELLKRRGEVARKAPFIFAAQPGTARVSELSNKHPRPAGTDRRRPSFDDFPDSRR